VFILSDVLRFRKATGCALNRLQILLLTTTSTLPTSWRFVFNSTQTMTQPESSHIPVLCLK